MRCKRGQCKTTAECQHLPVLSAVYTNTISTQDSIIVLAASSRWTWKKKTLSENLVRKNRTNTGCVGGWRDACPAALHSPLDTRFAHGQNDIYLSSKPDTRLRVIIHRDTRVRQVVKLYIINGREIGWSNDTREKIRKREKMSYDKDENPRVNRR